MRDKANFINKERQVNIMKMNKRGQELSIGTLILIILGVVVLALIIIGLTTGFDWLTKIFDVGPGSDLEVVVQGCNIAAQGELYIDYCRTFKEIEIDGEEQFVTCEFGEVSKALTDTLDCAGKGYVEAELAKTYCTGAGVKADTLVNGRPCAGDASSNPWSVEGGTEEP